MDNEELQCLVAAISLSSFQLPFRHQATFNARLRTTGGRYHLNSHHLDFNPAVLEKYGREELIGVIKHELCHYHLHLSGRGYRHQDRDFKALLQQTGGSRYVQPLATPKDTDRRYVYQCADCLSVYVRRRRMDTQKYVCGKCRGKLMLADVNQQPAGK